MLQNFLGNPRISVLLVIMIACFSLKYWRQLHRATCTRLIPWRNRSYHLPQATIRTTPKPRQREHIPLTPIPEETKSEITETPLPLNLTVYPKAMPLQVDSARLATSEVSGPSRKEARSTHESDDRIF
jgi:hypothetical protein